MPALRPRIQSCPGWGRTDSFSQMSLVWFIFYHESKEDRLITLILQPKLWIMDIKSFTNNLQKYADYYNPNTLFEKIKKVARKAGVKIVYVVLLLYYSTLDKELPMKDRLMVLAALGYFILPLDMIPDALPIGFTDDMAALVYVLKQVWNNLTPATKQKAHDRLKEWFGEVSEEDLHIPGL